MDRVIFKTKKLQHEDQAEPFPFCCSMSCIGKICLSLGPDATEAWAYGVLPPNLQKP